MGCQGEEDRILGWVSFLLGLHPGPVSLSQTCRLVGPPFLYQQNVAVEALTKEFTKPSVQYKCFILNFQEHLTSFLKIYALQLGPGILKAHS